jgi:hypothetical protein
MRFKEGTTAAYYAKLYSQIEKDLQAWEPTMFDDLSSLMFQRKVINQKPIFKDSKYTTENGLADINVRFANVKSDDGENISIDCAVYAEDVYIFNSQQCLRKALDKYQPETD